MGSVFGGADGAVEVEHSFVGGAALKATTAGDRANEQEDEEDSDDLEEDGEEEEKAGDDVSCALATPAGDCVVDLKPEFEAYYSALHLCDDAAWRLSLERLRQPLPPAFRFQASCSSMAGCSEEAELLRLLSPWCPEAVPWCRGAFRLLNAGALGPKGRLVDKRLNQILLSAQRAGQINRQETASMVPALALGVEANHLVLDLCAAPGSKTMQVLELLHADRRGDSVEPPTGLLIANDFKSKRLNRVIERARRVPASPLLTTCADARKYPNIFWSHGQSARVQFDRVLCDVPCSGDGTIRKARGLLAKWNPRAGLCHHGDQLAILCRGLEMLAPGGLVAYSTCSLNPVECEAVVAAALAWSQGSVEVVRAAIPNLELAAGLTSWSVPSPKAAWSDELGPPHHKTYSAWEEVPLEDRSTGQLRRTMFPPIAYATSAVDAEVISAQLVRCGRLLPAYDNGGCFFLALLRKKEHAGAPLRKGDEVIVRSTGDVATVRGPGKGPYMGLTRIRYSSGEYYHCRTSDLDRIVQGGLSHLDAGRTVAIAAERETATLVQAISDADWMELADFFGLVTDPAEAAAAGVAPFPRHALVYGPDPLYNGTGTAGVGVCLASDSLRRIGRAPNPRPVARTIFFRPGMGGSVPTGPTSRHSWPADAFQWRPAPEVARALALCCTRRVARVPGGIAALRLLVATLEVEPSIVGVDGSWCPGVVFLLPAAPTEGAQEGQVVLVGLLAEGVVRPVFHKGFNYRCLA